MLVAEEMSREELIVLVRRQAGQIDVMAGQVSELRQANEALAASWPAWSICSRGTRVTPRVLRRKMMTRARPRR